MPGFRLRRANQTVAIDSNYFNLALRQKGTLVLSNAPNPSVPNTKQGTIAVNGNESFIAYRCSEPVAMVLAKAQNGVVEYTFTGISAGNIGIDWYLFDLPEYGQAFASAGKFIVRRPSDARVVFDSRMKYLKVLDFFENVNSGDQYRDYGRYPAIVMVNRAWGHSASRMSDNRVMVQISSSMAWVSGNRVYYGGRQIAVGFQAAGAPTFSYSGGKPQYMVIDVQDY